MSVSGAQARGSLYLGTGESFVFSFPQGADACKASWIPGRPTNFLCCSTQLLSVGDRCVCLRACLLLCEILGAQRNWNEEETRLLANF